MNGEQLAALKKAKQKEYRERRKVMKREAQIEGATEALNDGFKDLREVAPAEPRESGDPDEAF